MSPGIGGSTSVPEETRVSVWLETVPALLKHLSISHVVPVSHSAGTTYLLNLISLRRDLLLPRTPYAVLLGEQSLVFLKYKPSSRLIGRIDSTVGGA